MTEQQTIAPDPSFRQANFPCRLCDSEGMQLFYAQGNDGRFRYYRCDNCGLVNLDLSEGTDQTQFNLEFRDPKDESADWIRILDSTFARIRKWAPDATSLCDIGCGNGRLLYLAQQRGWRTLGLELEEAVAERTADYLGVEVVASNFLEYDPPPQHAEAYDVVLLRHVLEHLPDSRLAMQKISALLKPGGHALLEFPNVNSLDKRLKRTLVNAGLHKRRFKDDFMPGHCNEFARGSFRYLLEQTGFRLLKWETYSSKPVADFIYNHWPIGNKARALARKDD